MKNLSREQLMKQVEEQRELVRTAKEAIEVDIRSLRSQLTKTESKQRKLKGHEKTLADLQAKLAKMKRGKK